MKTFKSVLALSITIILLSLFLVNCGDDNEGITLPPDLPIVTVVTTPDEINDTIPIFLGGSVEFDIAITAEGGFNTLSLTGRDMANNLIINEDTSRAPGETVTVFNVNYAFDFSDPLFENQIIDVTISVTDDQNQTSNEEFVIVINEGIDEFTAVLIGGFNNNNLGSSYDAQSDSVFLANNIRNDVTNQSRIDFVYYFADLPQRTIASPDNDEAEITWGAQNPGSTWPFGSIENSTRFKIPLGTTNFAGLATPNDLSSLFGEVDTGDSRVTDLTEGTVVSFQLGGDRGSRFGAFEVAAVEGNSSGTITLNVKIERQDN